MLHPNQQAFLNWLRQYDAPLYAVLLEQAELRGSPLAADDETGWFDSLTNSFSKGIDSISSTLEKGLDSYKNYRLNREEVKTQIKRVRQGLPPQPQTPPANPTPPKREEAPVIKTVAIETFRSSNAMSAALPLILGGAAIWILTTKKKGQ